MTCPSEQDPVSPSNSFTHQEASISLLSLSIRGRLYNHRRLTKWITWTTAFFNSIKLQDMPCRATQDRWVMVENSNKMWSTGEGNGKPLKYCCLENPMNSMKRGNDRTLKEKLPRSVGAQYATGDQWRNKSRKMKRQSQRKNNAQLWMWLVMEVNSDDVKSNIAWNLEC